LDIELLTPVSGLRTLNSDLSATYHGLSNPVSRTPNHCFFAFGLLFGLRTPDSELRTLNSLPLVTAFLPWTLEFWSTDADFGIGGDHETSLPILHSFVSE